MRVTLALTVATLRKVSHLQPASGWNSRHLTYMIKCDNGCGNIGTVRILQTMGTPIVREQVPMPVMLLEVMGLALDYNFVDFGFNWTVRAWFDERWNPIDSFALRTGSYVVRMNEESLDPEDYPPIVIDVEGLYMPAD
ncbi:hypothetical protein KY290_028658 [Solanum tuberosum]|uniref:Uncharacterized protein n=1 Tax=Solanum tuberosum TaxID=4113 RepID=A0ABQ7UII8_SOLTU|nr:hypothetical protein KY290_028658 [Solanum tuberosum]